MELPAFTTTTKIPFKSSHNTFTTTTITRINHSKRFRPCLPTRYHALNSINMTLLQPQQQRQKTSPQIQFTPSSPNFQSHPIPDHPNWRYIGPSLSKGALPTIIYFALTSRQSLELDPYNQFITHLFSTKPESSSFRVLSVTLPYHTDEIPLTNDPFHQWNQVYNAGGDLVNGYVRKVCESIEKLIETNIIQSNQIYITGLSRGGLIGALVASRCKDVKVCLAFAPVTVLNELDEFKGFNGRTAERIDRASLLRNDVIQALCKMPVRIYMGNCDERVGTRLAFELVHLLVMNAKKLGVRSPPHEFIMYCSVGRQGHGTPADIFQAGAEYMRSHLLDSHHHNQ